MSDGTRIEWADACPVVTINTASPPGAWRSALAPGASCAACGQAECTHPDLIYQGLVPLLPSESHP